MAAPLFMDAHGVVEPNGARHTLSSTDESRLILNRLDTIINRIMKVEKALDDINTRLDSFVTKEEFLPFKKIINAKANSK